jgi:hypothetical protein
LAVGTTPATATFKMADVQQQALLPLDMLE